MNWIPEPRDVPEGLDEDFQAEPYADPWNSIMERIAHADPATLRALTNWGTGDPDAQG